MSTSNEEHYKPHRDTLSGDSIPVSPIAHDDHTHDYLEALVASPREADVRSLAFEDRLSVDHFFGSKQRFLYSHMPRRHSFHLRNGTSMV